MTKTLRQRVLAGELLVGCFLKTPAPQVVEILGHASLDFVVIDQEHAPIDIGQMDILALAGRAAGLPLISRRWGSGTDWIAPLLDLGLDGVMVPHVVSADAAEAVCDAVRFARGKRGLSPSPRAGNYGGMTIADYRTASDARSLAVVQIEDVEALEHLDAIAAIADVDMLFIGPADLSQSMGVAFPSAALDAEIERIIAAATAAGKAVGLFVGSAEQVAPWHAKGVTVFVCGSDQSLLRQGAARLAAVAHAGSATTA
ncbi:HpcH/HpaI aldolase family protein [Frigidibacter sp. MR17.24]|uniref:HpcH/HpaI aldolase family protein n=1 Tax=Frigidibacter sp. MR17.24 TaxID=3127345 RepID=UPI003012D653